MNDSALVSTEWLAEHRSAPDVRIVDATWFLPTVDRDPKAEYENAHIPKSAFFDIDDIADSDSDLPHMVPSATKFASRVRKLGLGDGNRIVVYDNNRFCASARAWWMFRLFGHDDVAVLDGGFAKWQAEGREIGDYPDSRTERHFTPRLNTMLVSQLDDVRANITTKRAQLIDVRSAGRFFATEPEPRQGLRSGHIPGSSNLPFGELIAEDGTLRPVDELRAIFERTGIDLKKPIVTTCGSGVSAAVASLALYQLGAKDCSVYDGSWSEWGSRPDTPVVR